MKNKRETGRGFSDYYVKQTGQGMAVYSGASMQRGHGIGNILRGLFRIATPLIKTAGKEAFRQSKPILKKIGKQVLKRGLDEMTSATSPKIVKMMGKTVRAAALPLLRRSLPSARGSPARGSPARGRPARGRSRKVDIFS